jgi:cellulose synthase/poly-beta-1,6-N-acetylglucosamine synthase-like glycosyltransferase
MLSVIITAYKEEKTIGSAIEMLVGDNSGIGRGVIDQNWELIVVAPDEPTIRASRETATKLGLNETNFNLLVDQKQGKPAALNQAFKAVKGDWLLLTDGDVIFKEGALGRLVQTAQTSDEIGGVTGRPVSVNVDQRGTSFMSMLAYWGMLLADAAHHKRTVDLTTSSSGYSTKIVPKRKFFPLSGYIMLIRNLNISLPNDALVDDAFLSYEIYNRGYKMAYEPAAEVEVKYPDNISDYFKQKKRSAGGFVQLWEYGVVRQDTKSRSFWRELEYFWFPLKYARSLRELIWSICLYPARLWLWIAIYWERKVIKKDFSKTWVRIESTK